MQTIKVGNMKIKFKLVIVFLLFSALIPFNACKRSTLEDPLPTGPSSLATLLTLTASPNTLSAGTIPQTTTISARLAEYDGNPLPNETIVFEICDAQGNKINIGYFEGNVSTVSGITNASGAVTLTYNGPLASEIQGNTYVYIWATVVTDSNETISQSAPIYIIADTIELRLDIFANPTVLNAGAARESSTITSTLRNLVGGTPLANWNIRFEICDADGNRIYVGYFDSNEQVVVKISDINGTATVIYYGPLGLELPTLTSGKYIIVYIRVTAWFGTVSVSKVTPIYIYKT